MFTLPGKLRQWSFAFFLILFCGIDLLVVRDIPWLKDNVTGIRFIVNYCISFIGLVSLVWLTARFLVRNRALQIAGFCLVFLPVINQASYFGIYKNFVTPFGFGFVKENPLMTFQLYIETADPVRIAIAIVLSLFAFTVLVSGHRPRTTWPAFVHGALFTGVLAHSVFGWYSVTLFQTSPIAYYGTLVESVARKASTFKVERPDVPMPINTPASLPNIIWVIGESTVLSHMGIYGYERNTTPNLNALEKEKKLVALKNAVSIGTKTRLSIPYLCTGLQGPDPHGAFYTYPTMFTYAKARGYATALFSAQDFKWGHLDKILVDKSVDTYADGSRYDPRVDVRKGADDLVVLEKAVIPFLNTRSFCPRKAAIVSMRLTIQSSIPTPFSTACTMRCSAGILVRGFFSLPTMAKTWAAKRACSTTAILTLLCTTRSLFSCPAKVMTRLPCKNRRR